MTFVEPCERDRGEVQRPEAVVDFFEGDVFTRQGVGDKQRGAGQETQPLLLTRRTSMWPGYSIGGSRVGTDRGEGA